MLNPLTDFLNTASRVREFTFREKQFRFECEGNGDLYFACLYPEATTAAQQGVHFATTNSRKLGPYPILIYGDCLAIAGTIAMPDGVPPDLSTVYAIYDSEPTLFGAMRAAALEVLGVEGQGSAGFGAWQSVYRSAREGLLLLGDVHSPEAGAVASLSAKFEAITKIAVSALQEWRVDLSGVVDDEDLAAVSDFAIEPLRGN